MQCFKPGCDYCLPLGVPEGPGAEIFGLIGFDDSGFRLPLFESQRFELCWIVDADAAPTKGVRRFAQLALSVGAHLGPLGFVGLSHGIRGTHPLGGEIHRVKGVGAAARCDEIGDVLRRALRYDMACEVRGESVRVAEGGFRYQCAQGRLRTRNEYVEDLGRGCGVHDSPERPDGRALRAHDRRRVAMVPLIVSARIKLHDAAGSIDPDADDDASRLDDATRIAVYDPDALAILAEDEAIADGEISNAAVGEVVAARRPARLLTQQFLVQIPDGVAIRRDQENVFGDVPLGGVPGYDLGNSFVLSRDEIQRAVSRKQVNCRFERALPLRFDRVADEIDHVEMPRARLSDGSRSAH